MSFSIRDLQVKYLYVSTLLIVFACGLKSYSYIQLNNAFLEIIKSNNLTIDPILCETDENKFKHHWQNLLTIYQENEIDISQRDAEWLKLVANEPSAIYHQALDNPSQLTNREIILLSSLPRGCPNVTDAQRDNWANLVYLYSSTNELPPHALQRLSLYYFQTRQWEQAKSTLQQLVDRDLNTANDLLRLGITLRALNEHASAVSILSEYNTTEFADPIRVNFLLADSYFELGNFSEAEMQIELATTLFLQSQLETHLVDYRIFHLRGKLYEQEENIREAYANYQLAIEKYPTYQPSIFRLVFLAWQLDTLEITEHYVDKVVWEINNQDELLCLGQTIKMQLGHIDKAYHLINSRILQNGIDCTNRSFSTGNP